MQGPKTAACMPTQAILGMRLAAGLRASMQHVCIRCSILACVCWRREVLPSK